MTLLDEAAHELAQTVPNLELQAGNIPDMEACGVAHLGEGQELKEYINGIVHIVARNAPDEQSTVVGFLFAAFVLGAKAQELYDKEQNAES